MTIQKINVENTLKTMPNNGGCTLKNYNSIVYESGWQVATEGVEVKTVEDALKTISEYNGNCGIWYYNGIYYIDKSHRENTKKQAIKIGIECKQLTILKWATMDCIPVN